jgi:hypothetical protein
MVVGKSGLHPGADYVAGAIAGSANIILGFPADTVKVRLQNRLNPYSGAWHCFRSMLRNEGVSSHCPCWPQCHPKLVQTGE